MQRSHRLPSWRPLPLLAAGATTLALAYTQTRGGRSFALTLHNDTGQPVDVWAGPGQGDGVLHLLPGDVRTETVGHSILKGISDDNSGFVSVLLYVDGGGRTCSALAYFDAGSQRHVHMRVDVSLAKAEAGACLPSQSSTPEPTTQPATPSPARS